MKIGIFGGCFNPPHAMHYNIANSLLSEGYLDKVYFVPTGDTYDKKDLAKHEDRVEMLNLLINNENVAVSDISKSKEYDYTYQVLDYFNKKHPDSEIYFICGTDNLDWLDKWKRYEYILENYKILVIARNKDNIEKILEKYTKYLDHIVIAKIPETELSSTMIRNLVKEEKYDLLKELIDEKVLEYIQIKGLYKK